MVVVRCGQCGQRSGRVGGRPRRVKGTGTQLRVFGQFQNIIDSVTDSVALIELLSLWNTCSKGEAPFLFYLLPVEPTD